jgi:branched-chain amino acid transport system substrate-binding protein
MTPHQPVTIRMKRAVVFAAAVALLAGCGIRVSDSEVVNAASQGATVEGVTATGAPDLGSGEVGDLGATGTGDVDGTVPANNGTTTPGTGTGPAAAASGTKTSTGPGAVAPGSATGTAAQPGSTGTSANAGVTAGGKCTKALSPIIIGQTGAFSGLVGQSTGNIRVGLAVGVKHLNENGGIACHPVILHQKDDGSDPSKAAANVNDLVKNKKAVALVGLNEEIVMAAAAAEARRLNVPIIGGDQVAPEWYTDTNVFPIGGSAVPVFGGPLAAVTKATGLKKFGLLYCVEASACGTINDNFEAMSKPAGGQVLMKQAVSLTQTDFTSACQSAKAAGVEVLYLSVDASSVQRAARNCKSIGYAPPYVSVSIATAPSVVADPNVQAATFWVGAPHAPYVGTGTPALDQFHAAFKKYTGRDAQDQPMMYGWVDALFFARAIENLPLAIRSGTITTATILDGVYSLKNETLGGLIPPMTFTRGKVPPLVNCYSALRIGKDGVTSPTGNKPVCNA